MRDLPIVCELTSAEITARRATLLPGLLAQAAEQIPLPNGFRWRFAASSELLAAAAETITTERQCCRFLRFVLAIEPGRRVSRAPACPPRAMPIACRTVTR